MKKILITGFPHTGTSILKSKFGECTNLFEIINECDYINSNHIAQANGAEFIMAKSPIIPINIRANDVNLIRAENSIYKDYILVFVTRNPYNLFTSVIKSGRNPLAVYEPFSIDDPILVVHYLASLKIMKDIKERNIENTYTIRYEDFFDNDYKAIRDIMDSIGLKYNSDIFINKTKNYQLLNGISYENIDESKLSMSDDKISYRTWQINQPFKNMNSEINIPDELDKLLKKSLILNEFGYGDPHIIN